MKYFCGNMFWFIIYKKNTVFFKVFLVILLKICSIIMYDEKVMFINNYTIL